MSTPIRFPIYRILIFSGLLICLAQAGFGANWANPGTGNWDNPANWSPATVPTTGTTYIVNGGTAIIDSGIKSSTYVYLGGANSGTLYVQGVGTRLNLSTSTRVGDEGEAYMYILDGAVVYSAQNSCIAHFGGAYGIMTVSGTGSLFTSPAQLHMGHSPGADGTLNILDGATVTVGDILRMGYDSRATVKVNVEKGNLSAGTIGTDAGKGALNLYGSGSTITINNGYDTQPIKLQTNVLLDSTDDGNSPIKSNTGTIQLQGGKLVTAWGAAVRNLEDTFTIFTASAGSASYSGTFPMSGAPNMMIISNGSNTGGNTRDFVLGFDESSIPEWDMMIHEYFYPASIRKYDGWVEPVGTENFIARFVFDAATSSDWEATLLTYVNKGMAGSGASMTLFASEENYVDFFVPWKAIESDYRLFGWGLTHFNTLNGTDIRLEHLRLLDLLKENDLPEPAAWVMMLLGGAVIFALRKRSHYF